MRPICLAVLLLCAVAAASTGDLKAVDTSPLFDGFEDKLRRLQKRFCNVCYDLLEFPEAIFKVPRDAFDGIAWFVQERIPELPTHDENFRNRRAVCTRMLHERMRKVVTEDAAVMLAHLRLNPQIPITSDKIQAMWDKVTRKAVAEARQRGLDRIPSHGCHHEHGAGIPLTDQPGEGLSKPSGTEENDNSEREQNATHENGQAPKELTPNKRTEHARHQAFWRAMILAEISPKGGARDSSHMGAPGVVLENRKPSSKSRIRQRVKKARLRQPSSPAAGTDSERSPQGCTTEKDNDLSTNGLRLGQPKRPVGSGCRASPSSERQGVLPGINAQGRQDRSRSPFSVERPDWLSKAGSAVEQNAWLLGTAAVGVGTVARDAIGRMFKPGMAGGWR